MINFFDFTFDSLIEFIEQNGFKKYNATQLCEWVYKKKKYDINLMSNLSNNLKSFLISKINFDLLEIVNKQSNNQTDKYLLKLHDNNKIECVLMNQDYGKSLCISTQVGCNMGCTFCESGRLKKVRNLSVNEIVSQIITIEKEERIRIDNVVIMGIGEPFDNYDNLVNAIKIMTHAKMIELGRRKITVSTCGIVPKIYEFAELDNGVNLAISLHAPNDEIRSKIMMINKAYNIKEIILSIEYYINRTNRRVTIEYILIKGVNDTTECANELASLLKGKLVYVNLIPYNETENNNYKKSDAFQIKKFYDILINKNINVTRRKEMGPKIDAACGQLRAHHEEGIC